MSEFQFEFDIHEGPGLKDVVSKYEINPFTKNKVIDLFIKKQSLNQLQRNKKRISLICP
jgi:hypothetical protein